VNAETVAKLVERGVLYVIDGNHGADRPRRDEFVEGGTPFVRAADMRDGQVDLDAADKINEVALKRIRKGFGLPGDALLAHKGTVGRVAVIPTDASEFVCSPQTTLWRSLDEAQLDQRYLSAFLRSAALQRQLNQCMNESDMAPYVSLTNQRGFIVPLPNIDVQRRIGQLIGDIDTLIRLTRRTAEVADALARLLFERRFIDTDLEGEQHSLRGIAEFVNGRNFTKAATGTGRVVIRIAELKNGPTESTVYNDVEAPEKHVADPGDVLFAWSGSLGVYRWAYPQALVNQHIFKVLPYDGIPAWFVYLHLQRAMPRFRRIAEDKATTMGHIKREHLDECLVTVPRDDVFEGHDDIRGLYELAHLKRTEALRLLRLAELLIPRLFSDLQAA
jgi:type I restriction enzyme, S subunit